jgi:hypothetical protein
MEAEYQLTWMEQTGLQEPAAAWAAPNRAHAVKIYFSDAGIRVFPRGEPEPSWQWSMELVGYGREERIRPVPQAELVVEKNRVEYRRDTVIEWYVNEQRGVEQGFTLQTPPPGQARDRVALELSLSGSLVPVVNDRGDSMFLRDADGATRLRYGGLRVFDAEGGELAARLALRSPSSGDEHDRLVILIDATEAVYPLTIDPLITTEVAKLTASDGAANDWFGQSVAISGDTVVVGMANDEDLGADSGSAYIFERNHGGADNWGQVRKLTASNGAAYDHFGYTVAISCDLVVVGAPNAEGETARSGAAYLFARNQGGADNWGEVKKLAASDGASINRFGASVAISCDTVLVGDTHDVGAGSRSGSAYVFERNNGGADNWGEAWKLTALDATAGDRFGWSVALSDDTAVIGADGDDDAGSVSGSAYVFERSQGGAWNEVQKLIASDAAAEDSFGQSVSISGDTAVIGADGNDDAGPSSGSAYVYERNQGGADNWGEVRKLTASDAAVMDYFGYSVAISGDAVVVGAFWEDEAAEDAGAAYVYERNRGGADNWGEVRKLIASDAAAGDSFGVWVAVSGGTVVVGAPYDDDAGYASGSAYIYVASDCDWVEQAKPVASDAAAEDLFGYSVAISADTLVIGAPGDNDAGSDSGSAYVVERNHGGADNWGEVLKLTASDAAAGDLFGRSVAVSGGTVVVGAPLNDDWSGSVYVFERNHGGADNWGEVQKLAVTGGPAQAAFGKSVGLSGDTAVVGTRNAIHVFELDSGEGKEIPAPDPPGCFGESVAISCDTLVVGDWCDDDAGTSSGSAYVFERNQGGADNWGMVQELMASDAEAGDRFGWSVAISCDTAVAGAYVKVPEAAYVFERNQGGADNWGEVKKLVASDGSHQFGWSVAIHGDTAVVGAHMDSDGAQYSSGSAYVFQRNQGGVDNWGEVQELTASDAAAEDWLGWSVAISGDTLLAGAVHDDEGAWRTGSAYVFKVDSTPPDEVQGAVVEGKSPTTVSWIDQGPGVWYDVASGMISELKADDGVASAECLDDDLPFTTCDDVRANPSPGEGYYYIIRGQHGCTGIGSYGYASSGEERMPEAACP